MLGDLMLNKWNYIKNEKIIGSLDLDQKYSEGEYTIIIVITKVYDWYDEKISLKGECLIYNERMEFEVENTLEKGLYTLIKIEEINKLFSIGNETNERLLCAFMVMGNDSNPMQMYNSIYMNREKSFNRIKDYSSNKHSDYYDVFVFSKNILVSTIAQYDDVQVFPYKYLKCTSEINYINSFFEEVVKLDLKFKEEKFNSLKPSCVFLETNIKADSYEAAEEYGIKKASLINNIYSILLKSHGHFFATVTLNKCKNMSKLNMFNTRYKGNLFLFVDQGHNVRHNYKKLSQKDSYLNVYFKLLNDAIEEENRMMKYYRYWNVLEGISDHYNLENNDMKRWDGTIVVGKNNTKLKVGKESLNKVYELVRLNYSDKSEELFLGDLDGIEKVKDFLSICYQRRCCCAHNGETCVNDLKKCTGDVKSRCIKYNIIHHSEPLGFQDKILRRIEDLVMDILRIELKKEAGESIKEKKLVDQMLKK